MITSTVTSISTGSGSSPHDVFVLGTSLYVVNYNSNVIQKWSKNGTGTPTQINIGSFSMNYFMYIDRYNSLYLCNENSDAVVRFPSGSSSYITVAGTPGSPGSSSKQLDFAQGFVVDDNLTIYIADQNNNRVQMWKNGSKNGTTVAGNGIAGSSFTELNTPSGVAVDQYGFIYVADSANNRIMRWTTFSNSGICVAGCTGSSGTQPNQFNWAAALAFDTQGSLYVNDYRNSRIQKFQILKSKPSQFTKLKTVFL